MGLKYTAEEFEELDLGDYRHRFPTETKGLTDQQIWDVVMPAEDDLEDEDWRKVFTEAQEKHAA